MRLAFAGLVLAQACGSPAVTREPGPEPPPTVIEARDAAVAQAAPVKIHFCDDDYAPDTTELSCRGEAGRPREVDLEPLRALVKVRRLDMEYTKVSDIRPLAALLELEELNLHPTPITDITPLALLPLIRLKLTGTNVTDFSPLAKMTTLRELDVSWTPFSDAKLLSGLIELTRLDLNHTKVRDFAPLVTLAKLEILDIADNDVANIDVVRHFGALTKLYAYAMPLKTLAAIAGLSLLERVIVFDTPLTDASPLMKLAQLRHVELSDRVAASQVAALKRAHPGIEVEIVPIKR